MADDIMVCRKCNEEYDSEHVPYLSTCGHCICKDCKETNAPMPCYCGGGTFERSSGPNLIAHLLFIQTEQDRVLIKELLEDLDELKFNPVKPKRESTSPPLSPTAPGPSSALPSLLSLSLASPVPPLQAPTRPLPQERHIPLAATPRPAPIQPAVPPERHLPSLGSPPRNRRATRSDEPPSPYKEKDTRENMPRSPYVEKPKQNEQRGIKPNRVITVENLNPAWTIPDINSRFGQLAPIVNRFPQRDFNGIIKQIDLHYEDIKSAKDVIFAMDKTPNDCGGELNVQFKNWSNRPNSIKPRTFEPGRTIIVGNWTPNIVEADLKKIFSRYGRVIACRRNMDMHGKLSGLAYVAFEASGCVKMAIENMGGKFVPELGVKLTVEELEPLYE